MTPNAPGRWWREAHGEREAVLVIANNGARELPRGADLVWFDASPGYFDELRVVGWQAVTGDGQWLGPVAPLGSVAPDVVARLVRDAYLTAWADALSEHRDLIRLRSKIRAEARDVETWLASDQSRALHAALTAAGADADAVIAEVER